MNKNGKKYVRNYKKKALSKILCWNLSEFDYMYKEYQHSMMEEACFLVNYRSKKSKETKKVKKRSVRSPIIIIRVPNIRKKRRRRKRSHLRPLLIPIVNIRSLAKADINPAKMIRTNVKMPEMKILAKKAPKLENH